MNRSLIAWATASLVGISMTAIQATAFAAKSVADTYPDRPIRLVIPFPPGGAGDIIGRILSVKLGEELRQQVVVENRGGGGQVIATQLTARAAPDGHTLFLTSATHAINPGLVKKLPYDTIKDFASITLVAESPIIFVVHPSLGVGSIQELISLAKSRPGSINYASSGPGTAGHLATEMLKSMAGIHLVHIPYKGASQAMVDVLSGQVPILCTSMFAALPHVKSGRLRALGVTGSTRSKVTPEIPTVAEQGLPKFYTTSWYALVAPAATPRAIIDKLHAVSVKVIRLPDVTEQFLSQGAAQPVGLSPEETTKFIQREIARWTELIERSGIKAE